MINMLVLLLCKWEGWYTRQNTPFFLELVGQVDKGCRTIKEVLKHPTK